MQFTMWMLLIVTACLLHAATAFERVCYLVNDHKGADVALSKLSANLCTRINLMPLHFNKETVYLSNKTRDEPVIAFVTALKQQNPRLKVLMTLVGSSNDFDYLGMNETACRSFGQTTLNFLRSYNLDGLDIDWEFPVYGTLKIYERRAFSNLLRCLSEVLRANGLLLSAAVAADETIAIVAYDFKSMVNNVDYINLMAYDFYFYKAHFPFTGHNSALFNRKTQLGYFATLNTAYAANFWERRGFPKPKIMVGIPTYARSYHLR